MNPEQVFELARIRLTPKQFEAWELYYRAGWSHSKIAIALDLDRSTVARRIYRAQWKLHKAMKEAA